jgi:hypothetical protein
MYCGYLAVIPEARTKLDIYAIFNSYRFPHLDIKKSLKILKG